MATTVGTLGSSRSSRLPTHAAVLLWLSDRLIVPALVQQAYRIAERVHPACADPRNGSSTPWLEAQRLGKAADYVHAADPDVRLPAIIVVVAATSSKPRTARAFQLANIPERRLG